mgnify:CR=1 FL=1
MEVCDKTKPDSSLRIGRASVVAFLTIAFLTPWLSCCAIAAINTVGSLFAASINNSRACSGWFAWTHFTMLFQSTSPSLMVSGKPLLSLSAAVDPMSTQAIRAATCAGDRPVFPKDALRAP